jgi:lipoprotein signal peptidase
MTLSASKAEGSVEESHPNAITHVPSHLRLWLFAVGILALDLWSKSWIFQNLAPSETSEIIPRVVVFQRQMNDGAVFGSLTGMVGLFVVASVFALAFVGVLFVSSSIKQRVLHIALGMILAGALGNLFDRAFIHADIAVFQSGTKIIGKVLEESSDSDTIRIGPWPDGEEARTFPRSELVELKSQGVVRDFIKFVPKFPRWVPVLGGIEMWPWVFNVADAALVVGVGVLLVCFWAERRRSHSVRRVATKKEAAAPVGD